MAKQLTLGETRSIQRTWLVPGIAVVAVGASAHSIVALFSSSTWFIWYAAMIAGYWLLSSVIHRFVRRPGLAEAVTITVAVIAAVVVLARVWAPIQSLNPKQVLWAAQQTVLGGIDAIRTQWVPLNPHPAVVATLGLVVLALVAAADTLARRQDARLVSLLPAAMLWLLPSFLGTAVHAASVALVVLCALLLLLTTGRRRRSTPANAGGFIAVGLVAAVVFTPLLAKLELTNRFELPSTDSVLASGERIEVGSDLGPQSTSVVYQMTTTNAQAPVLRVNTTEEFRAGAWHFAAITTPGYAITSDLWLPEAWPLLYPDQPRDVTSVEMHNLGGNLLPLPSEARMIGGAETLGAWHFYLDQDAMRVPGGVPGGLTYQITTLRELPTPNRLSSAQVGAAGAVAIEVPQNEHTTELAELAREITAGASNHYQQAMAIQQWLAVDGGFTYSPTLIPGASEDPIWNFLETKQGYCVQFATAFTMLARSIDIPTRMALGYLPGAQTEDGTYQVTGEQHHTWPEVYFEDYGWIRFEPTPSSHAGSPPPWADPNFAGTTTPVDPSETQTPIELSPGEEQATPSPAEPTAVESQSPASPSEVQTTSPGPAASPSPSDDAAGSSNSVITWLIGLLLLTAVSAAAVLGWRQRQSAANQRAAEIEIATQWSELRDGLVARDFDWPADRTETKLVANVLEQIKVRSGAELSQNNRTNLLSLSEAVILQRYGRPARAAGVEQPPVAQDVLRELDELLSPDPDGDPSAQLNDRK